MLQSGGPTHWNWRRTPGSDRTCNPHSNLAHDDSRAYALEPVRNAGPNHWNGGMRGVALGMRAARPAVTAHATHTAIAHTTTPGHMP